MELTLDPTIGDEGSVSVSVEIGAKVGQRIVKGASTPEPALSTHAGKFSVPFSRLMRYNP
jgi:hypothetical protein